jgi:FkbM family methyltransferase
MENYLNNLQIPENIRSIKIDIGLSYACPHSQLWLEHDDDLYVFGFEPNPDCIECIQAGNIQKRYHGHGDPIKQEYLDTRFGLIPVALGNVDAPQEMDFYQMERDCGTSSLYYPSESALGNIKTVTKVPVYSLKHFFDVFDWSRFEYIEYIKIDAQGADYDILLGAGDYLKDRVVYITAEPEYLTYSGCSQNTTENMTKYLESQGFIKVQHPNTRDPTFINSKYAHLKDNIYICQLG